MPRKKTKALHYSGLQLRYIEQLQLILKRMRRFPDRGLVGGRMPEDVQGALVIFFFGLDHPDLLLDVSPAAQEQRLELAKLMLEHPEFTVAAIHSFFIHKPKPEDSKSAAVRDFLLTERTVILPDGREVNPVGAKDGEIALAVERMHGFKTVSVDLVKKIRHELERLCADPVTDYIQFMLKATEGFDQMTPRQLQSKAAKASRKRLVAGLYRPSRH